MKLLNKLSILVKSLTRGPRLQQKKEPRAPSASKLPEAQAGPNRVAIEHDRALDEDRVADLLEQRLASPDVDSRQNETGG